jgi:microcystin degradation protein MlrC
VRLTVGGKHDDRHGAPLEVEGTVRNVTNGVLRFSGPVRTGTEGHLGPTAVVEANGVEIVLTTERVATIDQEIFRSQGIEPSQKKVLLIKSSLLYHASFAPIAAEIIDVDTPGLSTPQVRRLLYTRLTRPIFPLDDFEWNEVRSP